MYEPETVAIGQEAAQAVAPTAKPTAAPWWQTFLQTTGQYLVARETRRAAEEGAIRIPSLPEGAPVAYPTPTAPVYKPSYTPLIIGGGVLLGVLAFTMLKPKKRGRR